ncbi:MAG: hypothetical protein WCW01_05945 [Gammaproteobacteria bacterium]
MAFNPPSPSQNPASSTSSSNSSLSPTGRGSISCISMPRKFFPYMADSEEMVSPKGPLHQPK